MNRGKLAVILLIITCIFSMPLKAQEKTQSYYNSHESEILPDAGKAFQAGKYERTIELCKWHYIIVGDRSGDALRDKARNCLQLSDEMEQHLVDGDFPAAKECAASLLKINPDDVGAKAVLAAEEKPAEGPEPEKEESEQPEEVIEKEPEPEPVKLEEPKQEEPKPTEPFEPVPEPQADRMRIAAKASVSVLDLSQFAKTLAPGAGVDIYDIGGSRFGAGLGMFFCPYSFPDANGTIFGVDASILLRAARNVYPKLFAGAFNCRSKSEEYGPTNGMRLGAGVSFILARHLCLDAGVSFFPAVKLDGQETVVIPEVQYSFPQELSVLSAGISPMISIGWAF